MGTRRAEPAGSTGSEPVQRRCYLWQAPPYYALAVAGAGMQFFWVGNKDDVAERVLKQAAKISEDSLGIWHPDCQLVLTNLARAYVKTGKVELAEPLLKKVSEGTEVYGTDSVRYAATLRELAVVQQYQGRLAEAETTLRQALAGGKDATLAQRAQALIALAELQATMGEAKKPLSALKEAEVALEQALKALGSAPPASYMPLHAHSCAPESGVLKYSSATGKNSSAAVDPISFPGRGPVPR